MKDYSNYQCEDFADDEYFLAWVKHPDAESDNFWRSFIESHPGSFEAIEEARNLVISLSGVQPFTTAEKEHIWANIKEILPKPKNRHVVMPAFRYAAAACLVILLLSTAFMAARFFLNNDVTIKAAYAQKKQVILPDGSVVILNANSSLTYAKEFTKNQVREVWIDGEAYFNVKHLNKNAQKIKPGERFIVHAGDMDIEVLGTSFNVLQRRSNTQVSLIQGKVRLGFDKVSQKVIMKPGQLVEHTTGAITYHTTGQAHTAIAWLNNKIILNNTPMVQVVQKIEDNYGVKVKITDSFLQNEKLSGEMPSNNLDVLLDALEKAIGADITKVGEEVIIKSL